LYNSFVATRLDTFFLAWDVAAQAEVAGSDVVLASLSLVILLIIVLAHDIEADPSERTL